jgi:hypothetical protein
MLSSICKVGLMRYALMKAGVKETHARTGETHAQHQRGREEKEPNEKQDQDQEQLSLAESAMLEVPVLQVPLTEEEEEVLNSWRSATALASAQWQDDCPGYSV